MKFLIHIYGGAAALLYALDAFLLGTRRLTRAQERVGDAAERFGFAGGAGLEDSPVLVGVPRDVEGVALAVAEAVDDDAAQAALFVDALLQRLRLAPVQAQVATLRDVQRLLAGLQDLVRGGSGPRPPGNKSTDGWLLAPVRIVWVVLIRVGESPVNGVNISAAQRARQEGQNGCKCEHGPDFHRCPC